MARSCRDCLDTIEDVTRTYCSRHECTYGACARRVVNGGRCKMHAYCAVDGCTATRRQASAAKYCDDHATCDDLIPRRAPMLTGPCLVCARPIDKPTLKGAGRVLMLCHEHGHLRKTLGRWRHVYHLTDERIASLLADPRCWVCGGDLRWRFSPFSKRDTLDDKLVQVDHDHRCCAGEQSCGDCVRGLAHAECNRRAGAFEALVGALGAERAHALVDELTTARTGVRF